MFGDLLVVRDFFLLKSKSTSCVIGAPSVIVEFSHVDDLGLTAKRSRIMRPGGMIVLNQ